MTQVSRWYDRQFEFPTELYPNLCLRLRGTPARLEKIVRGCSREILVCKPEGKWSAQEHAGHLLDLEPVWSQRVSDFVNGRSELSVVDLSNRPTDEANHNARALEDLLTEFRRRGLRWLAEWKTSSQRCSPAPCCSRV